MPVREHCRFDRVNPCQAQVLRWLRERSAPRRAHARLAEIIGDFGIAAVIRLGTPGVLQP
jgi:hypothetical protein